MAHVKGKFERTCEQCLTAVSLPFYRLARFRFCSKKCRHLSMRDKTPWNKGTKGVMPPAWNKGTKGLVVSWNKGLAVYGQCTDCGEKTSIWTKRDKANRCKPCYVNFFFKTQENHPRWKGGVTSEKHRLRGKTEWKEWRAAVFARDDFTCKECGVRGAYIEPHHIIPLRSSKERLFDIKNGITLCRPCHQKTMWKEEVFADRYFALTTSI